MEWDLLNWQSLLIELAVVAIVLYLQIRNDAAINEIIKGRRKQEISRLVYGLDMAQAMMGTIRGANKEVVEKLDVLQKDLSSERVTELKEWSREMQRMSNGEAKLAKFAIDSITDLLEDYSLRYRIHDYLDSLNTAFEAFNRFEISYNHTGISPDTRDRLALLRADFDRIVDDPADIQTKLMSTLNSFMQEFDKNKKPTSSRITLFFKSKHDRTPQKSAG